MKVFVLLTIFLCSTSGHYYPPELLAMFETVVKECQEATQVDRVILRNMMNKKFTDDAKLKDFIFCVCRKHGMMNEDGTVNETGYENFAQTLPSTSNSVLKSCSDKRGFSGPETAYLIGKCYMEGLPKDINTAIKFD